jgi:RHS repeat-associated protein
MLTVNDDNFYVMDEYTEFENHSIKELSFYLYDHLGNTRMTYRILPTASATFTIEEMMDYDPYGKILRHYSTGGEKYLTTQHQRDTETGLDYHGARFYDCDVARFLSVDPLAVKRLGLSPFNYVQGNPIIRVDPDGKLDWVPVVLNSSYEENGTTVQSGFLGAKMEEGDTVESLAAFLDVSQERATEIFNQRNENGEVAIPNELVPEINQAIHESKNPTGNDYVDGFMPDVFEENYNCFESCVSIGKGQFIDYNSTLEGTDFVNELFYNAENASIDDMQFGRTIGRWTMDDFGSPDGLDTHGATYLGTSNNGTNYYWSKNGSISSPGVQTEQELNSQYGTMKGLRDDATPFYDMNR